jgi:AsmA protein
MRALKYTLIAVVALVVLLVGGAFVFLSTLDLNRYKPQIEQAVKERTGRTLKLQGDIKAALFPTLGADVAKVSLSERGSAQEFVSLESVHASVAVLPLLHGEVVVDKVKLKGLKANVVKGKDGKFNFDDLLQAQAEKPGSKPADKGGAKDESKVNFDVAGVEIENSAASYHDLATGKALELSAVHLSTGHLGERADGKLQFGAALKGANPALELKAELRGGYRVDLASKTYALTGIDGSMKGTLDKRAIEVTLAGSADADVGKQTMNADLTAKFDESTVHAKLGLAKFSPPAYLFDVNIDKLNLDQYFPPKAKPAATPGKEGGSAGAKQEEDTPIDLAALKDLNANGKLQIGALQAKGLKLANLKAEVKAANGRLDVSPHSASLYDGAVTGALSLQATGNRVILKESLANVQVGPLLRDVAQQDKLEGRGNVSLDVAGGGATVNALKKSLGGSAKVNLKDGAVKGINVAEILRKVKSLGGKSEEGAADSQQKTDFTELNATFAIKNGVAHNQDLDVKSPLIRVGGAGDIDIGKSTIDYTVKASVVASAKGQGGSGLEQLSGLTVPVKLSGPLDGMKYQVDYGAAASQLAKSKVGQKAKEALEQNKGKVEEQVRDRLKGLLGR